MLHWERQHLYLKVLKELPQTDSLEDLQVYYFTSRKLLPHFIFLGLLGVPPYPSLIYISQLGLLHQPAPLERSWGFTMTEIPGWVLDDVTAPAAPQPSDTFF
jgi:hypothetical protein